MNITMKGAGLLGMGNPGLKSTQDRLDRMAKRDNKIAFFEQQKQNLKTMKTDSLEDISRKLEMLHGYDDQIVLAKVEFNNSQVFHMLDEARELGEKIAEAAEKNAPKTPEERREDMIEEVTGVDMDGGILGEVMDELEDITEEMTEKAAEELEEMTEETLSEQDLKQALYQEPLSTEDPVEDDLLQDKYKRIDYRVQETDFLSKQSKEDENMPLSGIMTTSLLSANNSMKIARVQQGAKTRWTDTLACLMQR